MPNDTIVTCLYCKRELPFSETYVTLNGNRPDTYECRDEALCLEVFNEEVRDRCAS